MNEQVAVGQTYREVGAHAGRIVRVVSICDFAVPGYQRVNVRNIETGRRVTIRDSRLLDKSRFALVSEIGTLSPPVESGEVVLVP